MTIANKSQLLTSSSHERTGNGQRHKFHTLKATRDLLVFFIEIALLTCLPGSSCKRKKNVQKIISHVHNNLQRNQISLQAFLKTTLPHEKHKSQTKIIEKRTNTFPINFQE